MKKLGALLVLLSAIPAGAAVAKPSAARITGQRVSPASANRAHALAKIQAATGLGVNNPVIGRLSGGGGVLYRTSVDVENNTNTATEVDFFLDATDLTTGAPISVTGLIANNGPGTLLEGYSDVHYDDFIDTLRQNGLITQTEENDGLLGSMLFIFDGFNSFKGGQGSSQARFYSEAFGGTIGVAAKGTEITVDNPLSLVGVFRKTLNEADTPQLYANLFLNNVGELNDPRLPDTVSATDTVRLSAYSSSTGLPVGITKDYTIPKFQVVSVSDIFAQLSIPTTEDTILVFADVVPGSGNAAIEALAVEVDNTTHDGSSVEMGRADF
jgi:hypothetical protein